MSQKAFSKITVSEIIRMCNVNRKTFYYHFEDIQALLKWMFEQEAIEIVKHYDLMVDYTEVISLVFDYAANNAYIVNCAYDSLGRDVLKRFFGKTTMLKILNGLLDADTGSFSLGAKVQIGYYDQEHHVLHAEKTIFEEISDTYPTLTETQIRNMLAAFLFTGDDVFKVISSLSGGERGRVSLAKLMLSEANFLILDEPTNHLDIASKEILEEALNSYTGTVLYVSHDRYFINQTATRILDLTNQSVVNYIGDYDYYLEKKEELTEKYAPTAQEATEEVNEETPSEGKLTWQQQKEEQARKRKQENELKKVEKRIEELETRDKEIDDTLVLPDVCTNVGRCAELSREKDKIQAELEELYEKWEELA